MEQNDSTGFSSDPHSALNRSRPPSQRATERARRQQALIALTQVLGLTVWFSVSAVVPSLRVDWGLSATGAVWLTGAVQVGFAVGAFGSSVFNLADRLHPQLLLGAGAAAAAVCTVLVALLGNGMTVAVPLRFLTGVCLAGVYPVGMKLMVSWAPPARRGRALGVLIGALTLGSNVPQFISGLGALPWRDVLLVAAGIGVLGALTAVTLIRPGPHLSTDAPTRSPRYAFTMFAHAGPRLSNLGYFGHMWELYALWAWLPTFLLYAPDHHLLPLSTGLIAFLTMGVAGVAGCLLGGWGADRHGRVPAAVVPLVISGACCALSPLAYSAGSAVVLVLCTLWGASAVADSGVFSTTLSETAEPHLVGTALTAQTAIGFTITALSIQLVPLFAERLGWQYAFLVLIPGPALGAAAMAALPRALRQQQS